eukprot:scaffold79700_cov45-Cyclotella_meneghiniana.AAC.5
MVPSSAVLPTLMRDVGKSLKVSACVALGDNAGSGYRQLMAIGTGIVYDHDGFCILGEHSNLFGSCKSYAFLVVVDLFDKALETCADIVCRVSASLHPETLLVRYIGMTAAPFEFFAPRAVLVDSLGGGLRPAASTAAIY